jgi:hypothetical protein
MRNKMKSIVITLLTPLIVLIMPLALVVDVSAQANLACEGLSASGGSCDPQDNEPGVENVVETGLNILTFVAGFIAVIMVIIAGVRFITSQGDSGKVAGARSAVIYALIGIVIVALAQSIVFFILRQTS